MKLVINYKLPIIENNKIIRFDIIKKYNIKIQELYEIKGGDIFDELNLDDIIIKKENTESIIKKEKTTLEKNRKKYIIDSDIIKKLKIKSNIEKKIETYEINNIIFNNYNNLYDIKLLLYYLLDIPIENQNLYSFDNPNLFYTYENKITEELLNVNIENSQNNENIYENIPIDFDIYNNRINYIIKTNEKNTYLKDLTDNNIELNLYNLEDLIPNKNNLNLKIQQDEELLSIIFAGFIEKYYPYYTENLLLIYLLNENKYIEYPNLQIKKTHIIKKCENLNTIYNNNYKNKLKKYKINNYYRKLVYKLFSYNDIKILNLQEIFNNIEINKIDNLKKIELQLNVNEKILYFSKINIIKYISALNELNNTDKLFINDKNYNILLNTNNILNNENIIFFIYNIENKKYNINQDIFIILDEYYNIYLIYDILNYENIDLKIYENILISSINDFLSNLFKHNIISKKKEINNINLELITFNYQILFEKNIGLNGFKNLINEINNIEKINYFKISNIDYLNNIIELNIEYIDLNSRLNKIKELDQHVNNYYEYYININNIEKYERIIYTSKVIITNRIKDLKIDIINTNEKEYKIILNLINYLLFKISLNFKKTNDEFNNKSINKLKKLKEIDPVLYNINKKNTQNLYSRKCQSNQQPEIATKSEIEKNKISKYLKYWNFTTGEPIYYYCNNKKFPTVKFLTNLHPQNYCIPCCKKKALEDVKIKSKYTNIHNECLTNYIYNKKKSAYDEKSRYIINYSPKTIIENTRLMHIPNVLNKLFIKYYNIENKENNTLNENYYILGINQNIQNISNIGIIYILSLLLNKNIYDLTNYIKNLFIQDKDLINKIYNGILLNYFKSTKEFLTIFTNIFQNPNLLSNINYNFNEWNELLINIAKYLGYIIIIFEESENEKGEYLLDLKIPENIKYVNEFIYNNNNYKYVLVTKRIYNKKILYYPIIKTNYLEYNKNNIIKNKSFDYNHNIINLLSKIIKQKLNKPNKNSLTLLLIEEYILITSKYIIIEYFINQKNEIYAVLLKKNKEYIYVLIEKQQKLNSSYNNISNKNTDKKYNYNYVQIEKYNIKLNSILEFITDYNKFIYSKNKINYSEHIFKLYFTNLNKNIYNLEKINISNYIKSNNEYYDYLQISSFLLYNNKIIGLLINNYNFYLTINLNIEKGIELIKHKEKQIKSILQKKKLNKEDIKKIICHNFKQYNFKTKNLLYSPHTINKIIYNKEIKEDIRIIKLNESIYYTNLYNLLLIHFSNELYNLKNKIIRNKIKLLINNLTNKELQEIIKNTYYKINELVIKNIKIQENNIILKIQNNLNKFLKEIILKYYLKSSIASLKKIILNAFDNTIFLFDKLFIYNILELPKEESIKELDKILNNIIVDTKLNNKFNILNIELCNQTLESYYCKNNKLIISKKIYKELLEILYYDLTNPFKQTLILNLLKYNLNNIYKFKQYINEKIYIYL